MKYRSYLCPLFGGANNFGTFIADVVQILLPCRATNFDTDRYVLMF